MEGLSPQHDKADYDYTTEAFEIFGWKTLDGFDILKLYLYGLRTKAAKVSGLHFKQNIHLPWNKAGRKKYILQFRTSKRE